uniref:C2 domain-containing protein n=1 Tax=Aureoumbra lagunensis TaxID=44058 RepID=A0A7S3K6J2_9STRA|mmetsp:Transcript_17996/g.23458  ORF Transcript_17996/g.23458 Transcript_17996/m.23458 type:complete len:245 (+) Transcript_17996:20-754(+)
MLDLLYTTYVLGVGGVMGFLFFGPYFARRPRDADTDIVPENVLLMNNETGQVVAVRPLSVGTIDLRPRLVCQIHYAENLLNKAWTTKQSVRAEILLSDSNVLNLAKISTKTIYDGGIHPHWADTRGILTIILPSSQIDLSRLKLKIRIYCVNSLTIDALIAETDIGSLSACIHGNPIDLQLMPKGNVVLSLYIQNVNTLPLRPSADSISTTVVTPAGTTAALPTMTTISHQQEGSLPVAIARPL